MSAPRQLQRVQRNADGGATWRLACEVQIKHGHSFWTFILQVTSWEMPSSWMLQLWLDYLLASGHGHLPLGITSSGLLIRTRPLAQNVVHTSPENLETRRGELKGTSRLYGPPLRSRGQSFWLQIQRSWVRFPALPDVLRSSRSGRGSTQPRVDNWGAIWKK
jgi:hypothetical protein